MKIIFLTHPHFLNSPSMTRFSKMLVEEMTSRGHSVQVWSPNEIFFNLPFHKSIKKWLGYIDQYAIFPFLVKQRLRSIHPETLFVFTDQALGPWVPLAKDRPHVIHCHDFMAQRSGLGEIAENRTKWSGKRYQAMIRRGYQRGQNFIPVSEKTRKELFRFVSGGSVFSEVVYNGLGKEFKCYNPEEVRKRLSEKLGILLGKGYVLHVGGNQWYKNRSGVVDIYESWRTQYNGTIPLLLAGEPYSKQLAEQIRQSPFTDDIIHLGGLSDEQVSMLYSGASAFLFPSLDEGFGWPIAEAMACGCPVITTGLIPMTEVGGEAAFYIPRRPENREKVAEWVNEAAEVLNRVLSAPEHEKNAIRIAGFENIKRFDQEILINKIEAIYQKILEHRT